jgi:hypothetical protein
MANFAIIENDIVTNVIVAESKEIAEEVTGLEALETAGQPWTGWQRVEGEWIDPFKPVEVIEEELDTPSELEA